MRFSLRDRWGEKNIPCFQEKHEKIKKLLKTT